MVETVDGKSGWVQCSYIHIPACSQELRPEENHYIVSDFVVLNTSHVTASVLVCSFAKVPLDHDSAIGILEFGDDRLHVCDASTSHERRSPIEPKIYIVGAWFI